MNPMRDIRVEKVVINIGVGEAGEKLDRAVILLSKLTNKKVLVTKTSRRTTFGTPRNRPIGCKVTLRGKDALGFLKNAFEAVDNHVKGTVFDSQGNFSFGIKEHIELSGVKYDPDIGIYGMDVCVSLERRGYRVMRRRISSKMGHDHRIKPNEAQQFVEKSFGVKVTE